VLLEERGDAVAAEDAYRRADARGHAVGACNLGALLEQEGDLEGAREAYRRADQRGDARGTYCLGVALEGDGDRAGAEGAYRRAQQRGPARISRAAHAALVALAGTEDTGRRSGRPPEVQAASEPASATRPPKRQDERT
jgi:TPR repeat protein